jgi:6-phosphogluconolactonase
MIEVKSVVVVKTIIALLMALPMVFVTLSCASADAGKSSADMPQSYWVYVGTYTSPKSKGIYAMRLNARTGELSQPMVAAESPNPSFLAVHPSRRFLYAVNEQDEFNGRKTGGVSGFAIAADTGQLTAINQQSSGSTGPCHLAVDHTGRALAVANYAGGSTALLSIDAAGRLGEPMVIKHSGSSVDKSRQEAPHAHCATFDPGNRFLLVNDLGLDKILVYRFDANTGTLTPNDPSGGSAAAGSGPRHLAFHPSGRWAYVVNEMASTMSAYSYDAVKGTLTEMQTLSTLPAGGHAGNSCAEVEVHPSGKFVYSSNRGHNSIAIFAIDQQTGKLTPHGQQSTGGKTPRGFAIDPSGKFLLAGNQDSDTLVVFSIDANTGSLKQTGQTVNIGAPVSVVFVPAPRS